MSKPAKKLETRSLPQDFSPQTLPEILKLAKKIKGGTVLIYERLNKPFFMETERLIIRRLTPEDAGAICELSSDRMRSPMKNFDHQWPTDLEGCKNAAAYFASEDIYFAACLKPSMQLIGFIAYNSVDDNGILDLGHVWHTAYQDNDLDTEALSLMTQYAFEKLGVNGVCARNPLECEEQIVPLKSIGMEIVDTGKGSFVNDENGNPIEFTACGMLITREKWEEYNLESYSPKNKPEILRMVEENARKIEKNKVYHLKTANSGSYINGVPMLRWGEWRDNTYCGCATALLNAAGILVSYEEVMGLSGVCYQVIMRDDWDPSSQMPQNGKLCEKNVGDALGVSVYTVNEEKEVWEQAKKSIDSGFPVLLVAGRWAPEWTLACGYAVEDGKEKFFGRTYFDCQAYDISQKIIEHQSTNVPENEIYTENKYFYSSGFPGWYPGALTRFYDKKCEPISRKQALKVSLDMCIEMFKQQPGEHHRFGYDAYDVMISGFELDDAQYQVKCCCDQYHIGSLQDARRAAYVYLDASTSLLDGENKVKLAETAKIYKKILDNLLAAVPYEKTTSVFNNNSDPIWNTTQRRELVAALRVNKELERQVRVIVKDILDHWYK